MTFAGSRSLAQASKQRNGDPKNGAGTAASAQEPMTFNQLSIVAPIRFVKKGIVMRIGVCAV
jgi:hypothetical protein